jgi:hypothetical protein
LDKFLVTSFWPISQNHAEEKVYSQEDLDEAVEKYLEGMKLRAVCKAFPNVPERTITCLAKKKRDGIEARRPGPPPILFVEIEDDLKAWICWHAVSRVPCLHGCHTYQRE